MSSDGRVIRDPDADKKATWERRLEAELLAIWSDHQDVVLEFLRKHKDVKKQIKAVGDDLLANEKMWAQFEKNHIQLMLPLFEDAMEEGALLAIASLPFEIGIEWELVNTAAAEWAKGYTFDLVSGINKTTQSRLQKSLNNWIEAGEDFPALVTRVSKVFSNPVRANLIAATEITRVYTEANTIAWQESGVVTGRQWLTANDERVCFPAWTMVDTLIGALPIQQIRPGMQVYTHDGPHIVLTTSETAYRGNMAQILTDCGWVMCTAEHRFWVKDKQSWVRADRLKEGQLLQHINGHGAVIHRVQFLPGTGTVVYNLEIEDAHEFYANGLRVHNCPICAPLGGLTMTDEGAKPAAVSTQLRRAVITALNKPFIHPGTGMEYTPPAHPGCRCDIAPIVM